MGTVARDPQRCRLYRIRGDGASRCSYKTEPSLKGEILSRRQPENLTNASPSPSLSLGACGTLRSRFSERVLPFGERCFNSHCLSLG